MARIAWCGLGKLGLVCALTLAKHGGHSLIGYDPSTRPNEILRGEVPPPQEEGIEALLSGADLSLAASPAQLVAATDGVVFVAVQTPHSAAYGGEAPMPEEPRDFEYQFLVQAVRDICRAAAEQAKPITVNVVSTCLPGTVNRLIRPLLNEWTTLVYNPAFIAMGSTIADYLNPEFVLLGADDPADVEPVLAIHHTVHDRPAQVMRIESAELTKVAYNVVISTKIVVANALMEICHKTGADCDDVADALAMATDRVVSAKYMRGGMGDGGHCFPAGELVMTADGPRAIETVEPGDRVMVGDGTLRAVKKRWERDYDGPLHTVKVRGMPAVRMTEDHPVFAATDLRPRRTDGRRVTARKIADALSSQVETEAKSLTVDHLTSWPIAADCGIEAPEHATYDYCRLAGWYLAEGHIDALYSTTGSGVMRSGRVGFALHALEYDFAREIEGLLLLLAPAHESGRGQGAKVSHVVDGNRRTLRYGSAELCTKLLADFGKLSYGKRLPDWVLFGDLKWGTAMLRGLWLGDGHMPNGRHEHWNYSTTSPDLAYGVAMILGRHGVPATIRSIKPRTGRDGVQHRHAYEVRVDAEQDRRVLSDLVGVERADGPQPKLYDTTPVVDGSIRRHVQKNQAEHFAGKVYNLWVEDRNEFVMACGLVHNCHPRDLIAMSWLAQRLDLSTDVLGYMARAREAQSGWLADLVQQWAEQTGLDVMILGKAYKPGSDLTGGSPALLLAHQLKQRGVLFDHRDPHTDPYFGGLDDIPAPQQRVFVIATRHDVFLDYRFPAGSVVIDPHGYMPDQPGVTTIRVGRKR
jgi:UDP-glucose 6-dehydrogenase